MDNEDDDAFSGQFCENEARPTHQPTMTHQPTAPSPKPSPAPSSDTCTRGGECMKKDTHCCSGKCHWVSDDACHYNYRCNDAGSDLGNIVYDDSECRDDILDGSGITGFFNFLFAAMGFAYLLCVCTIMSALGVGCYCCCRRNRRNVAQKQFAEAVFVQGDQAGYATVVVDDGTNPMGSSSLVEPLVAERYVESADF